MIKTVWSSIFKCYVAVDTKDVLNQHKGVSPANAEAKLKYAAEKDPTGFKLTEADLKAIRDACTPDLSSLKKK